MGIKSEVEKVVELKKAGQSFLGICPFHKEKTPSFIVRPKTNTFNCAGCGVKGGVEEFKKLAEGIK